MGVQSWVLENRKRCNIAETNTLRHYFQDIGYFVPENLFPFSAFPLECFAFADVQHFVSANPQIVEPRCKTEILFCPISATIGEIASSVHLCIFAIVSNL